MAKRKFVLSAIQLTDIYNDTVQTFGGITVPNVHAADLVIAYPQWCYIKKTTLGARVLCVVRRDGKPFVVDATNATAGIYNPPVVNYIRLFGGRRRPNPKK